MKKETVNTIASTAAIFAGLSALAYAYFFVVVKDPFYYSLFLFLQGLLVLEVIAILFGKVKQVNEDYARVALVFGVLGASGILIHGGYDLANVINPPASVAADLPSQIDPRGLLTFGMTGLAILKFSYLMTKEKSFPQGLTLLGMLSGILLVVIYLGRLIVLDPANPILLYPVLLEGFIIGPLWYLWLGTVLKKE